MGSCCSSCLKGEEKPAKKEFDPWESFARISAILADLNSVTPVKKVESKEKVLLR